MTTMTEARERPWADDPRRTRCLRATAPKGRAAAEAPLPPSDLSERRTRPGPYVRGGDANRHARPAAATQKRRRRSPKTLAVLAGLPPDALLTVAEARRLGLSRAQLCGPSFRRVINGVYCRADHVDSSEDWLRIRAVAKALGPDTVIGGFSALRIWGVALPWTAMADPRVSIVVPRDRTLSVRPEVLAQPLVDFASVELRPVRGIRVAAPHEAWAMVANKVTAEELVQVGDGLVRYREPLITLEELRGFVDRREARRGGRGTPALRTALEGIRPGTDSLPETWLRQRIVAAGYPPPLVNPTVTDQNGRFVGRPDMYWEELALRVEYDGQYHNDPDQHARDTIRDRAFEALGIVCAVATKKDLPDPSGFLRHFGRLWEQQRMRAAGGSR